MRIEELIKSLDSSKNYSYLKDFEVCGISCNSKQVSDNFIFVAVKGTREDGNSYIDEAIKRGARAVVLPAPCSLSPAPRNISVIPVTDTRKALAKLAAEFYGYPSLKLKVIGITGTNGKTTISYLLEALLKKAHLSPAVIGTINCRFKNSVTPSKNTTPGPVELESMLADMLKGGATHAIMEVSSHALDQDRTGGINFHSAIFTNLTQDHLDYHKTLGNYFNAKAKLFKNMQPGSFAVINNDDKYAKRIKEITKARIFTYGIENKAEVTAGKIKFDSLHTEFLLDSPAGETNITSGLVGRHNVYNILAAVAWALQEGIDMPMIKSAIAEFNLVPGRLERVDFDGDFSVFVDYAHTEDALRNIITTLRRIAKKKIIVVFGCGGERDKTKRPKMGKVVSELADYAIITNDNPRSEDAGQIINDIKRGIRKNNYCVIPERREAIKKSLSLAKAGDIVLIAGKGHEDYQILRDKVMRFSDREVVRECLKSMNY
jgi:UDP-N-acetylmuramoyl-L-alanyl-D-glutamate--2,6-diaminopimelate ligase/murE/murF fusion protein